MSTSTRSTPVRQGLTLLEVIVVMTILALMVGMLLPAIQKVRSAAARMKGLNNLRQISLATHSYANANQERLPYFPYRQPNLFVDSNPLVDVLLHINMYQNYAGDSGQWRRYVGAIFQDPLDPSYAELPKVGGDTSFVASALVFRKGMQLGLCCPDGSSSTIGWTQQYANCSGHAFLSNEAAPCGIVFISSPPWNGRPFYTSNRRHSFADRECGDVYPVTTDGVTRPARDYYDVDHTLFQVAPRAQDCSPNVPTAPHPAGLACAMMDGSIRTLPGSISPSVFWALVTPNGDEVIGDW